MAVQNITPEILGVKGSDVSNRLSDVDLLIPPTVLAVLVMKL